MLSYLGLYGLCRPFQIQWDDSPAGKKAFEYRVSVKRDVGHVGMCFMVRLVRFKTSFSHAGTVRMNMATTRHILNSSKGTKSYRIISHGILRRPLIHIKRAKRLNLCRDGHVDRAYLISITSATTRCLSQNTPAASEGY